MSFKPRIDSQFSLSDLVSDIVDPHHISVQKQKKPDYKINFSMTQSGGRRYRIKLMGVTRVFNSYDERMGKIPHETVCNLLEGTSDMKLWAAGLKGPEINLSPDYVDTDQKLFIEVSTVKSANQKAMEDRMKEKIVHYKTVAENNNYQIGIIIISADSVYTNMNLSQEVIDSLCHRYRSGLGIHGKLENLEGRSLQSEDNNPRLTIVKGIVKDLSRPGLKRIPKSKHFPLEIILDFKNKPTGKEMKKAANLLRRCRLESQDQVPGSEKSLDEYIQKYGTDCRTDKKRVGNIPMVLPKVDDTEGYSLDLDYNDTAMPSWLKQIWKESETVKQFKVDPQKEKDEALGRTEFVQHRVQKTQCFNVKLDDEDKEEASTTGLWGKSMRNTPKYREHKAKTKKGFHPVNTPTDDIDLFINGDALNENKSNWFKTIPEDITNLMEDAKKLWTSESPLSLEILKSLSKTKLVTHASLVTSLFTEICYCYKYWIKRADFYKKWCGNVQMVIRCVGEHTFVSYAFPKKEFASWDSGRLGPTLYESSNYIFTDICSYNEPTIEHFVKSGPYMLSILIHLLSNMDTNLDSITSFSPHIRKTMAGIYLLFINNKTDAEELMTNQRYLTMGVLEDLNPNPFKFTKRLPDMYKSRLTCYLFKRTHREMMRYSKKSPTKFPFEENGVTSLEFDGLEGIFSGETLNFRQKINEFYFGYVVSKERGRGADRNFKIMKKIVEQQYKYMDDDHPLFTDGNDVKDNQTHISMLKTLLFFYKESLKERYGENWQDLMETNLYERLSQITFLDIATLKVSSRNYEHTLVMPIVTPEMSTSEIKDALTTLNPEEVKSRPKVMQSLSECVEQFMKDEKKEDLKHIIEMVPWALKEIETRGFFYSDIFPKPQHGGDREIHVLEFRARLIQLYVERVSRTLCEMTPSDSLTHSKLKDNFVRNHYNFAEAELPTQRLTMGKSADASKWCQRHHASKFAAALTGLLPTGFINGILRILFFWTTKVIVFPVQFVANFVSNKDIESNPTYKRMQQEFNTGTGIFPIAKQNRMVISSGMMQGILHYTSSLFHAILQVSMATIQKVYLERKNISSVITIIQGSDDSGELLSLSGKKPGILMKIGTIMLHWKERVSRFVSIYPSYEKSCIGSTDLIEFNSEWSVRKTTLKPTFRWVSACMEVGIVEKFIDRLNNFYNTATSILEGGGSVLETAVVQLSQAWMHYWMLGVGNHSLSSQTAKLLMVCKDPSLGYFPVDSDFAAGMPGMDFLLYCLYKKTAFGNGVTQGRFPEPDLDMYQEDVKDATISRDLRKVHLKFGNHKIFEKILQGMNVPSLEILLADAEANPELIYYPESSWANSKTRIYMKIFEPGVKESLSKHSATARILSASAYIISRPCLSFWEGKNVVKISLLKALARSYARSVGSTKINISDVFIHHKEYEDILTSISSFDRTLSVQNVKLRSRNKHLITIIDREMFDVSIVELCKQIWFTRGGRTGLSSSQEGRKWDQAKKMYPFLKNSRTETEKALNMSAVQLKNFLDSLTEKPRKITLLDSAAKGGSLKTVLSRIFWPSTKLHLKDEVDDHTTVASMRSELFSICSHWMSNSAKIRAITEILSSSKLLESESAPFRVKKLRIMRLALEGTDKSDLISEILRNKLGSVGFFTVQQGGWGWNRKGYGEWKGKVLESACVIEFNESVCTKITLDKISGASELGHLLNDFIESTCSSFPTERMDSDHWLSPGGKINGGRGTMKAIPIVLDSDLKVQIFDELRNKDWILETSNNIIRLKAVFPRGQNITILSERFLSFDWDPVFRVSKSKEYSAWNNSEPMSVNEIQQELSSHLNGKRGQCLRDIKDMYNLRTSSGWNLGQFTDCIKRFFQLQIREPDLKESPSTLQKQDLTKEEESWISDMISGTIDFDWDTIRIEPEPETESDYDFEEIELDDGFDDRVKLLMEERDFSPTTDLRTMPATNRCFQNLDILCKAFTNGISFRQNLIDFQENSQYSISGVMGKIISLILKEDRMSRSNAEEENSAFLKEEESISLMTSIRTDAKAAALSEEGLRRNIDEINSILETKTGFLRDSLLETRTRLERLLYVKRYPTQATAIGEMKTTDFLLACKPLLEKKSTKFKVICEMSNDFFFPLIQSELDKLVVKLTDTASITPIESAVYRESVMRPNTTTLIVDLMSELVGSPITVGDYSTAGDDSLRVDLEL